MDLFVDDAGFVRGPAATTYRRLVDIAAWPLWWRGTRVRRLPPPIPGGQAWALELTGAALRRLRLAAQPRDWRDDVGFVLDIDGDLVGRAEFWLGAEHGGTVVHHVLAGRSPHGTARQSRRVLEDYRRAIRVGLWGLKDVVQLEARTAAGLEP